jgi:hypothetical protein
MSVMVRSTSAWNPDLRLASRNMSESILEVAMEERSSDVLTLPANCRGVVKRIGGAVAVCVFLVSGAPVSGCRGRGLRGAKHIL